MDLPFLPGKFPLPPLTAAERKLLGFLAALVLVGAANLGLQRLTGQGEEAWAYRAAAERAPLPEAPRPFRAWSPLKGRVLDVNRASAAQLRWVPGVGPETARRIVQYRRAQGDFRGLRDLERVKGLGPKKLAKMAPYLRASSGAPGAP